MEFFNGILVKAFSGSIFCLFFYPNCSVLQNAIVMKRFEFSCFADFFESIIKTREEYGFL